MKRIAGIWAALGAAALLAGCTSSFANPAELQEAYKTVKVQQVAFEAAKESLDYTGVIGPDEEADLSFKASGRLVDLTVEEGDTVSVGQPLAVLDTEDMSLQLESMGSQLQAARQDAERTAESRSFAEKDWQRAQTLLGAGAISQTEADQKKLAYDQARLGADMSTQALRRLETEVKRAQKNLTEGVLRAETSAVVDRILVEAGEVVSPGQPVMTLRSAEQIAVAYVTAEDRKVLRVGNPVTVSADGREVAGTVRFIGSSSDAATFKYRVEITLAGEVLSDGAVGICRFITGEFQGIWIPLLSIQSSTVDFVYVVEDGKAVKRVITMADINGDRVLVKGLKPGEQLIVSGMKSLVEGMAVRAEE